ncbi:MAG TPA: lytic transglycosylase domain-containing protein [Burkholderiaceae bacterium]|nr:lytic transglycosylase domain-containing protein [Burkholderiaceae bacterium]
MPATATPAAASAAVDGEKFRLIAQQCIVLAAPVQVHRAAQLDLYGGTSSVTIRMSDLEDDGATPVAPFTLPPAFQTPRPGRDGLRVVSLAPAVTAAAQAHDLDPLLLHAIAHVESRHNPKAVSPAGARGLMQVMPATARRFGVGDPERALFDAETNLRAGAAYLRTLRRRYGNDLNLMLAAYNAGEGAVAKHGGVIPPYAETQNYVRDVLAVYRRLSASFAVSEAGALVARGEPGAEPRGDAR